MILFEGIKIKDKVALIKFSNSENKSCIEVPIAKDVANVISQHLSKISLAVPKIVERGNDEESE